MNQHDNQNDIIDVGDSIQNGIFRWYAYFQKNIELDGCGIDTIPDDIYTLMIKRGGKWGLKNSKSKNKMKYLLNKIISNYDNSIFPDDIFYYGTQNQLIWIKNKLIEKGISENDIEIINIE